MDTGAGRGGVTPRLSSRLIHSCSHRFTCDRRLGFRAAQDAGGRRGTVVHSPRKRVKGQPFRGFKSHLHRSDLQERRSSRPKGGRLVLSQSHLVVSVTSMRGAATGD